MVAMSTWGGISSVRPLPLPSGKRIRSLQTGRMQFIHAARCYVSSLANRTARLRLSPIYSYSGFMPVAAESKAKPHQKGQISTIF